MEDHKVECLEHSGVCMALEALEKEQQARGERVKRLEERTDRIYARLNVILGGISVACILLVINILIEISKRSLH